LADRLGWTVVAVHVDNDLSAYSGKPRPGYRALLDDLRASRADAVLSWHTDRLHRSPAELEAFITVCEEHAVAVQTVVAGVIDLTTPTGRMQARIAGAVARQEVEHGRERMLRAKEQAASAGRWRGGRRPLGYAEDGRTVVPAEAAALRRAAEDVVAGASLAATARRFAATGVKSSTGGEVDSRALRRLLMRPRNAGLIDVRGEVVGQADWPPIIPEDVWRGCVAVLRDPTRTTSTGNVPVWLGSGLFRCGVEGCGATMRVMLGGHSGRRVKAYTCTTSRHLVRRADQVDALVHAVIEGRLGRPDAADLLAVADDPERVAQAQTSVITLRQKLTDLAAAYAADAITLPQLTDATAAVRARLEATERDLSSRGGVLAGVLATADPVAAWRGAPLDRQRSILDALVTVTITPARRGRRPGWRPGEPYFDPETVIFEWKADQ